MVLFLELNVVGIVIVYGSVGDVILVMVLDVYILDDGGYFWIKMLEGFYYYIILDFGGIIVVIEYSSCFINVIKFFIDEGQCW